MGGKKEPSKNRLYEKERRDRLNVSFEELRTVLPATETNASLGKAEIINHAVDFIRILQSEKQLKISNIHRKEIIRLKNRIAQLCNKIKYLLSLLKESKIEIPKEKPNKRSLLKITSKSKQIKDSTIKNSCIQKLKKKSKLLPKPVSILLQNKPLNLPVLATSNKPTFIVPNGHLIKIETTPIIPQSQIVYDVPKLLLLPEYKSSERLIVPKKNDATNTTSVNKRPIPSLTTYNSLLKKTNFFKETKTTNLNDANLKKKPEPTNESTNKKKLDSENINKNNTTEAEKRDSLETVKISDNKCIRSHTIEAIVKDINQEKNEKQTEREENITNNSSSSENEIKCNNSENINSNKLSNVHPPDCLSSTPTTSAVVNSLSILTEENQSKSMETAKNIMSCFDDIRLPMPNTDFSTDLFSSLQGPVGGHHADSMSPTEAFLLSFPLVSTSKNTSILNETEHNDIHSATPTTILQIGNLESPATELFQKNLEDCEKDQNKNKTKDSYSYNGKPYYNENYLDTSKKSDDIFGYNKEVKKSKLITTSQPSITTYHKTHFNDIASYYKTTQSSSDLWRYTSYNSYDKNVNKNIKKTDKSTSTAFTNNVPYVPYDINPTTYIDTENYNEVWPHKPKQKKKQNDKNVLVNWMTDKGCQNLYPKKNDDNYQKKNNFDMTFDIQPEPKQTYSWSPSKTLPLLPHLDTNMPSTLPTLVGDLALNINTGTNTPFDQRVYDCNKKNDNVIPITSNEQNMFNYINSKSRSVNSNFLSVSQLVEQPKTNDKRKGKSCAKDYCCVYQNQKTDKDYYQNQTKQYYPDSNTFEQDQSWVRSKYSHDSSRSTNHSAESLIRSHQKNNSNLKLNPKNQHILPNKQTTYYKTGQKPSYSNNENISNYYNQHNSNYLYDCRNDIDKQPSTYQIAPNFYNPPVTTKHNIANYIPLPTTFNMTNSTYNKPIQHFTQNTNNYYNNSNNVNTLTNFNLSTIFPEINDKESNNITSLEGSSKNNEFDAIINYGTAIHPTFWYDIKTL